MHMTIRRLEDIDLICCISGGRLCKMIMTIPQLRHASAAYLIPTLSPIAGDVTPVPTATTSPTPIEH